MATTQEPFGPETRVDPEAAFRVPVGAASPLWIAFGAAAVGASAWWWMTRWAREGVAAVEALRPPEPPSFAPADDAPDAAAEAVAEDAGLVIDPVIEAPVAFTPIPETPAALAEAAALAVEAASEPVAPQTAEAVADDLTRLVGVGPKLAAALAERGVTRFAQIAAWQARELDEIDRALSLKGRATREAWVAQARKLAAE